MTTRAALRYEGKAKRVYETDDPTLQIIEYTDGATAFNGEKRATITGKGALNNKISAALMQAVAEAGVPTHFVALLGEHEQLVRRVDIVPLEVVVRNIVAGSLANRMGLDEGTPLPTPIVEFYYKRDDLGDPLLNRAHIQALGIVSPGCVDRIERRASRVNDVLLGHLASRGITLVDFKLEFGFTADGELLLADEISPDTCRFWDSATGEKLDKDRFRRDLGDLVEGYAQVLDKVGVGA
jgi:phosphoribosylaminoimidazole-succinocarboxamide synthase